MRVVLFQPDIPGNVGNVARLCAATNVALDLIEPLGFELNDARLKRAGMDYWRHVTWRSWSDWRTFLADAEADANGGARLWFVESGGPIRYDQADFRLSDRIVFGRESSGLPKSLLETHRDRWLSVPMLNPHARSLNLSNCVALVVYEALRQNGFAGSEGAGPR